MGSFSVFLISRRYTLPVSSLCCRESDAKPFCIFVNCSYKPNSSCTINLPLLISCLDETYLTQLIPSQSLSAMVAAKQIIPLQGVVTSGTDWKSISRIILDIQPDLHGNAIGICFAPARQPFSPSDSANPISHKIPTIDHRGDTGSF